jgi:hypothetical protein
MKKLPYIKFAIIVLGTCLVINFAYGATKDKVWNEEYETYLNQDYEHHVICQFSGTGNGAPVWSEEYEQCIPNNFPRHVIKQSDITKQTTAMIWSEEYEGIVSADYPHHVIGLGPICLAD